MQSQKLFSSTVIWTVTVFTWIAVLATSSVSGDIINPAERCALLNTNGSFVCNNCFQLIDCATLSVHTNCSADEICDVNIDDGLCIALSTPGLSPNCTCQNEGCLQDPNNSEYIVQCSPNFTNSSLGLPTCGNNTLQILNTSTCTCETAECPSCEYITTDTSECPSSFLYCNSDGYVSDPLPCGSGFCFNQTTCGCEEPYVPTIPCPSCGAYPDPDSTDGTGFCICGDSIPTICNACSNDYKFDESQCKCVDESVILTTTELQSVITTVASEPPTGITTDKTQSVVTTTETSEPPTDISTDKTQSVLTTTVASEPPTDISTDKTQSALTTTVASEPPTDISTDKTQSVVTTTVASEPPTDISTDKTQAAVTTTVASEPTSKSTTEDATVVTTVKTETPAIIPCNCGFTNLSDTDCTEYYQCDGNVLISGPYNCLSGYCFDPSICKCVLE